ncbi:MAG TPA: sigma-70 family RNA polymerase sigma factor [Kofleriaceae bacterium]|jgi:RNA polymerase sigma-70 factor (ECF subfamily)|nr:sigma-70 family RNA polymerase sigma factor [Kofleriaceae bacterium]
MRSTEIEVAIRERFDANDLRAAATLAIEAYGGEVCGYLAAVLSDDEQGREVFAETAAELWRDLSRFRWEASLRTWIYTLARHRLAAHIGRRVRQPAVALSEVTDSSALQAQPRTTTPPWKRTAVKDAVSQLRSRLSADDQTLLILRVDRGMSWREIAHVLGEPREPMLRKRFERIKKLLRDLAQKN